MLGSLPSCWVHVSARRSLCSLLPSSNYSTTPHSKQLGIPCLLLEGTTTVQETCQRLTASQEASRPSSRQRPSDSIWKQPSLPRARNPDQEEQERGSEKAEETKRLFVRREALYGARTTSPAASPSGCYWQPGNHRFPVPDIIIIINTGYLSHSFISRNSQIFTSSILSALR